MIDTEISKMKIIELELPKAVAEPEALAPVKIERVYCDMDGVIADFAKGVSKIMPEFQEGVTEANKKLDGKMWARISAYQKEGGKFWLDLEPMVDAHQLWNYIKQFDLYILSAAGQPNFGAAEQKIEWLNRHFQIDPSKINIVQKAVEKAKFANPAAVLIDDKRKALDPFEAAGGHGVWHKNAADSILQLKALGL